MKKKNGSKNRVLNDFLIKCGHVSSIVCSCKSSYRESLYFSEVDAFLVSNKKREREIMILCYLFFSRTTIFTDIGIIQSCRFL